MTFPAHTLIKDGALWRGRLVARGQVVREVVAPTRLEAARKLLAAHAAWVGPS